MDWLEYNSENNSWLDLRDNVVFSINTKWRTPFVEKGHVKSKDWKNFHFLDGKYWKEQGAIKWFRQHFGYDSCLKHFEKLHITEEMMLSQNQDFSHFKGKSVIVVSGGPSSKEVAAEKMMEYDYRFTCNHFFKNPEYLNIPFDMILLGQEVDLKDRVLVDYIKRHNPLVGFEQSDGRRTSQDVVDFAVNNNARAFLYLTRYFSKLGFGPRQVVLATLLGCSKVDFTGIDGWKDPDYHAHAFETNKPPPVFNHLHSFQRQMVIFWQYIHNICDDTQTIKNLTETSILNAYEGIMDRVLRELGR